MITRARLEWLTFMTRVVLSGLLITAVSLASLPVAVVTLFAARRLYAAITTRLARALLRLWDTDRDAYRAELARFIDVHARAMAPLRENFQGVVRAGPAQWLAGALARIDGLPARPGDTEATTSAPEPGEKLGMCGILRPLDVASAV